MSDFTPPAVRTALIDLAVATLPKSDGRDFQVQRGEYGTRLNPERLLIHAARGDVQPANIGQPSRWEEGYDIAGEFRVYKGKEDFQAAEDRVWVLFQLLATAIHADQGLGGRVLRAFVSSWEFDSGHSDQGGGVGALLSFTVHIVNQTV